MKFFLFLCLWISCLFHIQAKAKDYILDIPSKAVFDSLAGDPLTHAFPGIRSVKLVYRISNHQLYFLNSKKYPLHYSFCKDYFQDTDLSIFNQQNYSDNPDRHYYLATLNYFRDAQLYTVEFSAADGIQPEEIEMLFQNLKNHFFASAKLYLQLSTPGLIGHSPWHIPVMSIPELMGQQQIQIIQQGEVRGRLLVVDGDSLQQGVDYSQAILLLKGNTNEVPYCRGICCGTFQTPLSHVSVLSQNRGTPLVAMKLIPEAISALAGQMVIFKVTEDTFLMVRDSAGREWKTGKRKLTRLRMDTSQRELKPVGKLRMRDVIAYGVKAVYLGQLQRVSYEGRRIHTPEGAFAIPMFYYWQHLQRCGADTLINRLLMEEDTLSGLEVGERLKTIREVIRKADLDRLLLARIEGKMKQYGVSERYRFRSSSNAEDLKGFNGAGLYTSETGWMHHKDQSIARAIRKVWASLWYERAYMERKMAGIDQHALGMAILAHVSFPDEYANGVAITKNLYRDYDFGFVINMQKGDKSLVRPGVSIPCEQLISYYNTSDAFFNERESVDYLSFSVLNANQPLLTTREVYVLTQQLARIKDHFYRKLKGWRYAAYKDFAMDVEFKVMVQEGKKVIYFKQARTFGK